MTAPRYRPGRSDADVAVSGRADDASLRAGAHPPPTGTRRVGALFEQVLQHEPPVEDGPAAVYRRVDRMRRRRVRTLIGVGVGLVLVVGAIGYGVTTALLPRAATLIGAETTPTVPSEPVLAVLAPVLARKGYRIVPRPPLGGTGWRQYLVVAGDGKPHGVVEISAYATPNGLCFPVLADAKACARPQIAPGNVDYVRYGADKDVDWQVTEVIARRRADGRTIAVLATGERGTGNATAGRPPLTGPETARVAIDPRTADAFAPQELCTAPDAACPALKVPVPQKP
jgi:hypothetical protein